MVGKGGNVSHGPIILFIFLMLCVNELVHVVQQHPCSHSPLKVQVMGSSDSCVLPLTPGKTGNVRMKEWCVCLPFAQVQISEVHITAQGDWKCSKVPQLGYSLKDKNTQGFCYFVFITYLYLDPIQKKVEKNRTRLDLCYLLCKALLIVKIHSDVLHKAKK